MRARATLISSAPGFIRASRLASISPAVSGARAQAIRTASHSGSMRSSSVRGVNGFSRRRVGDRAAVGGEDAAFESGSAFGHLTPDPAVADDPYGAAHHLAMR